ncbi:hypothetical protein JTE90_023241 [Oedothorax gibbosus]|uniref:Uncharacterized protein n=1 Tax=Oedothorax gibbosus TaxID=931172 RepID=A0AAV6TPY4_9ARAC|nr:hypothetical protein JTE90_023241 [Oedothorax gibbosus]
MASSSGILPGRPFRASFTSLQPFEASVGLSQVPDGSWTALYEISLMPLLEQVLPCLCVRPDISAFWINGREPIDFALVCLLSGGCAAFRGDPPPLLNNSQRVHFRLSSPWPPPVASSTRGKTVPCAPPPKCHNVPHPRCRYVPHQSPHLPVSFRRFGDPEPPSDLVLVPGTPAASTPPGPKNSPSSHPLDENWSLVFSPSLSKRAIYSRTETSRAMASSETKPDPAPSLETLEPLTTPPPYLRPPPPGATRCGARCFARPRPAPSRHLSTLWGLC